LYILFLIVALVIFLSIFLPAKKGTRGDRIFYVSLISIIIGFCIFMFLLCLGTMGPTHGVPPVKITEYSQPVASIRDSSSVVGSFFLGCGSIGEKQYYIYYEDWRNGKYKQRKILVDDTIICEEKKSKPRIDWQGTKYGHNKRILPDGWFGEGPEHFTSKTIYVPKGTIIQEFKLE